MLSSLQMIPRTLRATPAIARAAPTMRLQAARMPATLPSFARGYASGGGLTQEQIQQRITDVIKSFEKVDPSKITPTASFTGDLGLDSLDSVEVVMAIEEEFNIVRCAHAHPRKSPTRRRTTSPPSTRPWTTSRTPRMVRWRATYPAI